MDFVFSKREIARRAAMKASEEWHAGAGHLAQGGRIDYWAYVINAALDAIPEPSGDGNCKHVWPLQAILAQAHLWRMRNADVQYPDLDDLEEILLRDTTGSPSPAARIDARIAELEAQNVELRKAVADPNLLGLCKANAELGALCVEQGLRIAELEAQVSALHNTLADVPEHSNGPPYLGVALRDAMDRVHTAEARIAELEVRLAGIGKDMPEMLALCAHKDDRIAELEAQVALVREWEQVYGDKDDLTLAEWAVLRAVLRDRQGKVP